MAHEDTDFNGTPLFDVENWQNFQHVQRHEALHGSWASCRNVVDICDSDRQVL